jgi:hypothetical protein
MSPLTTHPDFTPAKTAAAIAGFLATRSNSALRLKRVKAELKRWGTAFRADSRLTSEYVAGEDMDVEEVCHRSVHKRLLHIHAFTLMM